MSTRGAVGIRFNETDKVAYNHFDSYPTGLGQEILNWLKDKDMEQLKTVFENVVLTEEHNEYGWDNELKSFQNAVGFLYDSLFCEYAYIINLDTGKLEFYTGFNRNKEAKGRYANCPKPYELSDGSLMYGVKLVKQIPLKEIFVGKWKTDEDKSFVKA